MGKTHSENEVIRVIGLTRCFLAALTQELKSAAIQMLNFILCKGNLKTSCSSPTSGLSAPISTVSKTRETRLNKLRTLQMRNHTTSFSVWSVLYSGYFSFRLFQNSYFLNNLLFCVRLLFSYCIVSLTMRLHRKFMVAARYDLGELVDLGYTRKKFVATFQCKK